MRIAALTSLIASLGVSLICTPAHASCDPRVLLTPTHFPEQSHLRGQEGVVFLQVTVDEFGRVSGTQLLRSSGFRLLDRAAAASVRERWVFDVSGCARKDLPASDWITVEYRSERRR
jgi:TonB family protein